MVGMPSSEGDRYCRPVFAPLHCRYKVDGYGKADSTAVPSERTRMPVVVVASFTAKSDSVDTVRDACKRAVEAVHQEPGCELYALHEANGTFVFVEQWADEDALKTHSTAPAIGALFGEVGEHLDGAPDIKMLHPVPAGDADKGRLRA
jgi:quinol monooxygenase YgiN